jgi:hypothetical protein
MKFILYLCSILFFHDFFAQDSLKTKSINNRRSFSIGVNISPDYCYRTITNSTNTAFGSYIFESRNAREIAKLGYTAGVDIMYTISKRLSIETGLQFSNKGYSNKYVELTFGDPIDPRYGFTYSSGTVSQPVNFRFIYSYYYLDIPLRAIYSFGRNKIRFVTGLGITTNIFLIQKTIGVFDNGYEITSKSTNSVRRINFSPTISLGGDYKINSRFNLRAEPTFRYGFMKTVDAPLGDHLWNAGFNISCYYSLESKSKR